MAAILLAMSLFGVLAATHQALHMIDGSTPVTHEQGSGDAHPLTSADASIFGELFHGFAHAWDCCATIAVLPTPTTKLLSVPPLLIHIFDARPAAAPELQNLFRPPIR
jgi:hypothetical protein